MEHKEQIEKSIEENFKWLDKILYSYILILLTTTIYILLNKKTIVILDVELKSSYFLLIFSIYTLAHYYITILVVKSIKPVWRLTLNDRQKIFYKLESQSNIFIRGIKKRNFEFDYLIGGEGYKTKFLTARINFNEMPFWAAIVTIILTLFVCIQSSYTKDVYINLLITIYIIILTSINWFIGSHWVVAFSELMEHKKESIFYKSLGNRNFFHSFSMYRNSDFLGSGGPVNNRVPRSIILFPFYFIANCVLQIIWFTLYMLILIPGSILYLFRRK